jgi:hypothetical protein
LTTSSPQFRRITAECTYAKHSGLSAGHVLIRTVWLGLFLLSLIGGLACYKFAYLEQRSATLMNSMALVAANAEPTRNVPATISDTLTKGDRLEVLHVKPALDVTPAKAQQSVEPPVVSKAAAPTIISRHWHDPSDQKLRPAQEKNPKRASKRNLPAVERKPIVEADSCKSGGLDSFRRIFGTTPSCNSGD